MVEHSVIDAGERQIVNRKILGGDILKKYDPEAYERIARKNIQQKLQQSVTSLTALEVAKEKAAKNLALQRNYKSMPSEDEYQKAVLKEAQPQIQTLVNSITSSMNRRNDTNSFQVTLTDEKLFKTASLIDGLNPIRMKDLKKQPKAYEDFCVEVLGIVSDDKIKNRDIAVSQALNNSLGLDSEVIAAQPAAKPTIPQTLPETDNTKSYELSFPNIKARAQKRKTVAEGVNALYAGNRTNETSKTASKPLVTRPENGPEDVKETEIVLDHAPIKKVTMPYMLHGKPYIPEGYQPDTSLDDANSQNTPAPQQAPEDGDTIVFNGQDKISSANDDRKPAKPASQAQTSTALVAIDAPSTEQKAKSTSMWTSLKKTATRLATGATVAFALVAGSADKLENEGLAANDIETSTSVDASVDTQPPTVAFKAAPPLPTTILAGHDTASSNTTTKAENADPVVAENSPALDYTNLENLHTQSTPVMPDFEAASTPPVTAPPLDYAALDQLHGAKKPVMPDFEAVATTMPEKPLTIENVGPRIVQFAEDNGGTVTPALQKQLDKIEYGLARNIPGHAEMGALDAFKNVADQFSEKAMPFVKEGFTMIRDNDGRVNTKAEKIAANALDNWATVTATYKHKEPKHAMQLAMK